MAVITESIRQKRFVFTVSWHIKTDSLRQLPSYENEKYPSVFPFACASPYKTENVRQNKSGCEGHPSQPQYHLFDLIDQILPTSNSQIWEVNSDTVVLLMNFAQHTSVIVEHGI